MALDIFVSITGQKQGHIKGGSLIKGREGQIEAFSFSTEIVSPRDPQSGLPTGKRLHKPIVFTKEIDKSSPLLASVLSTQENLTEVILRFYEPNIRPGVGAGQEVQFYTIKLTNANIVSIAMRMGNNKLAEFAKMPVWEEIALTYQKIEWTYTDGGITASDDWNAGS